MCEKCVLIFQFRDRSNSNFGRLSVSKGSGANYDNALRDLYKNTGLTKKNSVPSCVNGNVSGAGVMIPPICLIIADPIVV